MMTLDELEKIFIIGNGQAYCSTQDRLRTVVMALRDDMLNLYDTGCYFNEILSDGGSA